MSLSTDFEDLTGLPPSDDGKHSDEEAALHGDNLVHVDNYGEAHDSHDSTDGYKAEVLLPSLDLKTSPTQSHSVETTFENDAILKLNQQPTEGAKKEASPQILEKLKNNLPPRESSKDIASFPIRDLLFWKCPTTSGITFGTLLLFQFSLLYYSAISIVAYFGLFIITVSLGLKLYTQYVSTSGSYFDCYRQLQDCKWELSPEHVEAYTRVLLQYINADLACFRETLLFNNYTRAAKLAIAFYLLTYLGACFNLLTLSIIGTFAAFCLPKIYEANKREIDHALCLASKQIKVYVEIAKEKLADLPIVGPKLKKRD